MASAEKQNDGSWVEKTPHQFRADRNASIPDANLEAEGLYEVIVEPKPETSGKVAEKGPIEDRNGRPYQTWVERDPTAEEFALRKEKAVWSISRKRDELIDGGMTFNGVRYQTRPKDVKRIMGVGTIAMGAILAGAEVGDLRWENPNKDFKFIAEDNSETPMDAHTMFAFGKALAAHESALIFHARFLKDAVAAADTQQELDAVNIETGWPGQ